MTEEAKGCVRSVLTIVTPILVERFRAIIDAINAVHGKPVECWSIAPCQGGLIGVAVRLSNGEMDTYWIGPSWLQEALPHKTDAYSQKMQGGKAVEERTIVLRCQADAIVVDEIFLKPCTLLSGRNFCVEREVNLAHEEKANDLARAMDRVDRGPDVQFRNDTMIRMERGE